MWGDTRNWLSQVLAGRLARHAAVPDRHRSRQRLAHRDQHPYQADEQPTPGPQTAAALPSSSSLTRPDGEIDVLDTVFRRAEFGLATLDVWCTPE